MLSVHLCIGLLITIKPTVLSNQDVQDSNEEMTIEQGLEAYITGSRFFIMHKKLPPPEKQLKYSFIVVKHGMVVPEVVYARTYPKDPIYKDHWQPGIGTNRGRSLMLMVGRSLQTRYLEMIQQDPTLDHVVFSSVSKEAAIKLAAHLGFGLLKGTHGDHKALIDILSNWLTTDPNYEKIEKLSTVSAECPWMKQILKAYEEEIKAGTLHLIRCTENLYEQLRNFIPVVKERHNEWIMDSPARVYKLWSLLVFEVLQGLKEPKWVSDRWAQIQSCVFEYHRNLMAYHPVIPAVTSGRMIHQIEKELNEGKYKFHVHVTNDVGALSMNWTLPESKQDYWPDPGDAILYDFFTDDTVQVSSFSGWHRTFNKIYQAPKHKFFKEYKRRNIYLTEVDWEKVCSYDGEARPPRKIHPSLFVHPLKPNKYNRDSSETDGEEDFETLEDKVYSDSQVLNLRNILRLPQDLKESEHSEYNARDNAYSDDEVHSALQRIASSATEIPIGTDDSDEIQIGRDDSTEIPIGTDDSDEIQIGRDDATEIPIGRDDSDEIQIGRDDSTEIQIGRDDATEIPIGTNDATEIPISRSISDNTEITVVDVHSARENAYSDDEVLKSQNLQRSPQNLKTSKHPPKYNARENAYSDDEIYPASRREALNNEEDFTDVTISNAENDGTEIAITRGKNKVTEIPLSSGTDDVTDVPISDDGTDDGTGITISRPNANRLPVTRVPKLQSPAKKPKRGESEITVDRVGKHNTAKHGRSPSSSGKRKVTEIPLSGTDDVTDITISQGTDDVNEIAVTRVTKDETASKKQKHNAISQGVNEVPISRTGGRGKPQQSSSQGGSNVAVGRVNSHDQPKPGSRTSGGRGSGGNNSGARRGKTGQASNKPRTASQQGSNKVAEAKPKRTRQTDSEVKVGRVNNHKQTGDGTRELRIQDENEVTVGRVKDHGKTGGGTRELRIQDENEVTVGRVKDHGKTGGGTRELRIQDENEVTVGRVKDHGKTGDGTRELRIQDKDEITVGRVKDHGKTGDGTRELHVQDENEVTVGRVNSHESKPKSTAKGVNEIPISQVGGHGKPQRESASQGKNSITVARVDNNDQPKPASPNVGSKTSGTKVAAPGEGQRSSRGSGNTNTGARRRKNRPASNTRTASQPARNKVTEAKPGATSDTSKTGRNRQKEVAVARVKNHEQTPDEPKELHIDG